MSFDFAECFSTSARLVAARVIDKRLLLSFDVEDHWMPVHADHGRVTRALHRMMLAAVDLLDEGLLACNAHVDARGRPAVRFTGAGAVCVGGALGRVIERLALRRSTTPNGATVCTCTCPISGAQVQLVHDVVEGYVLAASFPFTLTPDRGPVWPSAHGAVAWTLLPHLPAMGTFGRRLERFGWRVTPFTGPHALEEARRRLVDGAPDIALAIEPARRLTALSGDWLRLPFPPGTRRVLSSPVGSECFRHRQAHPWQVVALPFSPHDIAELTAGVPGACEDGCLTMPQPLDGGRPRLLIVDDNPINRLVASAMGHALGYEAAVAEDGFAGLQRCAEIAPAAVLMDVNMPGLDGIETTRRIRADQQAGYMPPFPIVGASADVSDATAAAALAAGMDAFLLKPLSVRELQAELSRLCLRAPSGPARPLRPI